MSKNEWLKRMQYSFPKADPSILGFIADFRFSSATTETITNLFSNGYCYYFATMLEGAFERGVLCYAYPHDHIVWYDLISHLAYDINGVNTNWEYLIDVDDMDNYILDFKHIPGKYSDLMESEIEKRFEEIIEDDEIWKLGNL